MFEFTTRLEMNISAIDDINTLFNFVSSNKMPAIVSPPVFILPLLSHASRYNPRIKIICTVDFPYGRNFGMQKVLSLSRECMSADGFEIMLTPDRTDKECNNEQMAIIDFIKRQLNPTKEIRWVLGTRSRSYEQIKFHLTHFKDNRVEFIRNDNNLENSKLANDDYHMRDIKFITDYVASPVKLCGNINLETILRLNKLVSRFDVNFNQAQKIIAEYKTLSRETLEEKKENKIPPKEVLVPSKVVPPKEAPKVVSVPPVVGNKSNRRMRGR